MDDIRLVDADKLIAKLDAARDSYPNERIYENDIRDGIGYAMETIDCAPTIEAEPIRTATMREMDADERAILTSMPVFNMVCNNCGAMCFDDDSYCSECGAMFIDVERSVKR